MFDDLKEKFFNMGSKKVDGSEQKKNEKFISDKKPEGKAGMPSFMSNIIIVLLVGVLLVIVGSIFEGSKGTSGKSNGNGALAVAGDNTTTTAVMDENNEEYSAVDKAYKKSLEEELTSILEEIDGVGKVKAVINFENGVERIPVFNEDKSTSETKETDTSGGERNINQENGGSNVVMESNEGNQKPFITKENSPTISGILIVAEGADDRATELRVKQAALKLFGLEDEKVVVYPMKK
ncbi:MAG: stage III sporulation protein AG [Clostridium sp.]